MVLALFSCRPRPAFCQVGEPGGPGNEYYNGVYYCIVSFPDETSADMIQVIGYSLASYPRHLVGGESLGRLVSYAYIVRTHVGPDEVPGVRMHLTSRCRYCTV